MRFGLLSTFPLCLSWELPVQERPSSAVFEHVLWEIHGSRAPGTTMPWSTCGSRRTQGSSGASGTRKPLHLILCLQKYMQVSSARPLTQIGTRLLSHLCWQVYGRCSCPSAFISVSPARFPLLQKERSEWLPREIMIYQYFASSSQVVPSPSCPDFRLHQSSSVAVPCRNSVQTRHRVPGCEPL